MSENFLLSFDFFQPLIYRKTIIFTGLTKTSDMPKLAHGHVLPAPGAGRKTDIKQNLIPINTRLQTMTNW